MSNENRVYLGQTLKYFVRQKWRWSMIQADSRAWTKQNDGFHLPGTGKIWLTWWPTHLRVALQESSKKGERQESLHINKQHRPLKKLVKEHIPPFCRWRQRDQEVQGFAQDQIARPWASSLTSLAGGLPSCGKGKHSTRHACCKDWDNAREALAPLLGPQWVLSVS